MDFPTLKEELDRKVFEELERLATAKEKGLITNAEYKASIDTIFNIASGLLDKEFFEIISLAGSDFEKDYSFNRSRVFHDGTKMVNIIRWKDKSSFTYSVYATEVKNSNHIDGEIDGICDTEVVAEAKINRIIQTLIKQGYVEQL